MSEEAKGARKKALELMRDLTYRNVEVVIANIELEKARLRLLCVVRERDITAVQLTDLINRCMDSFGSDEGK
jgi:hypothetical protein